MTTDTSADIIERLMDKQRINNACAGREISHVGLEAEAAGLIRKLSQQLAEARTALSDIKGMGLDLRGAKMAHLKIGLSLLCDTASEALKPTTGEDSNG